MTSHPAVLLSGEKEHKKPVEEEPYPQPFPLKRKGNRFALQSRFLNGKGVKEAAGRDIVILNPD